MSMQITHRHPNPARSAARGLSLIELMVSLTLGLFLIAGMLTLLSRNSQTRDELDKAGRQVESGRYAVQRLTEDLHHAGFYGEYYSVPVPTSFLDPCGTGSTTYANLKIAMALPIQGYTAATTPPACINTANFVSGSNVLVLRFASPAVALQNWATTASAAASSVQTLTPGVTYMQANVDDVAFAASTGDATANFGSLKVSSGSATNLINAPVYRYVTRIYFLSPCNHPSSGTICSASADGGSPIPTLKMIELASVGGAAAWSAPIAVAEGVERLAYDYGMDSNADGSPDNYVDCSACALTDWPKVVAVRVNLVARNTEASPDYADAKSYSLGLAGSYAPPPTAQRYKRHAYQVLVRLNNISMRQEQ